MHPEWYYIYFDRVFSRGGSYAREVQQIAAMADLTGAEIQEIGAGTGNHAEALLRFPVARIELVDCDPKAVAVLQQRFAAYPFVRIRTANGFADSQDHRFDVVYSMYSVAIQNIASLLDLRARLELVRHRLRPGGSYVFEALDCSVSESVYPHGVESVVYACTATGDIVTVASFYDRNALTIQYAGMLAGEPIQYSVRLLRANRRELEAMVGDLFASQAVVAPLDEHGRRLLIKGEVA